MVKIVEVEFNIEASEETIAADKAAKIRPFIPTGIKFLINHGAALSLTIFPLDPIKPMSTDSCVKIPDSSKFITYAIIPGRTTMIGIINFKKAANAIPFCPSSRLFDASVL